MMNDSVLFSTFLINSKCDFPESTVPILPCLWHSPQGTFCGFVLSRRPAKMVFFCPGCIELADDDCDASSGFEGGSNSLKMSFCDKNVVWGFGDSVLGDGSPIVAF